jgi:predicted O-methyltransferase YrrM
MSIDIGAHEYVRPASNYINFLHPGRHRLIIGDSTEVFPTLVKAVNSKMDLIFIDGGHAYEIAKSDLECALAMSHADTIIVMDDTIYFPNWEKDYSKGPTTVWMEAVANGFIKDDVRLTMDQWNGISYGRPGPNSHTLKAEGAVSQ